MATKTNSPSMALVKTPGKAAAKAAPAPVVETTTAEPDAVEAEVVEASDMIAKTAHEIENMKQDKAFKLVPTLLDNIDHDYFRLGGVLAKVQSEGWFMEKGHETFRAFVESECGIQYRKAMYLIQIYNGLVESGVTWDQVKHLGWTKLKELANILSVDNVDEWVAIAENMTVMQLQEHIKISTKGEGAANSPEVEGQNSTAVSTMTFKVHDDQKATIREALDKAKHETGTEFDAVALEAMALEFLGGESKLKTKPTLKELMAEHSAEDVLNIFGEVFPNVSIEATLTE